MSIEETIKNRKTIKLKTDENKSLPVSDDIHFKLKVEELISTAGWAPFHYECNEKYRSGKLNGKEPWRFHALDAQTCRMLLKALQKNTPLKASDGIRQMLATAKTLILATWLPEPSSSRKKFYPNVKNMEHIAATGAAIQNLLLLASENGLINYWSSGGVLRKAPMLKFLGIPEDEILLGAIFLFPDPEESTEIITGKNREQRSTFKSWMDWVSIKENL